MNKLVLLGDSTIDNKVYVEPGELSVKEHLDSLVDYEVLQIALDGAITDDVLNNQIDLIPTDTTHILLSIGGNDLLQEIDFLYQDLMYTPKRLLETVIGLLSPVAENYETIVKQLSTNRAKLLCATVYEGNLVGSVEFDSISNSSKAMVSLLNDSIFRICDEHNLDTLDLRNIFVSPKDYANPIEPSHQWVEICQEDKRMGRYGNLI